MSQVLINRYLTELANLEKEVARRAGELESLRGQQRKPARMGVKIKHSFALCQTSH